MDAKKQMRWDKAQDEVHDDAYAEYMRGTSCDYELEGLEYAHEIAQNWGFENPIKDWKE